MRLRTGLLSPSPAWEQILRQEGVPWGLVDSAAPEPGEWSAIVVNRHLTSVERTLVERFLGRGGAILSPAQYVDGVCGTTVVPAHIDYLVNDQDAGWDVDLVTSDARAFIPREANILRTDAGARGVFAGPMGGGWGMLLPFDPAVLMFDGRARSRRFYSTRERLPSERVSVVDKNQIRMLVRQGLEFLHHMRGLPYLHMWYFPRGLSTVFAFRIDTDGASEEEVDRLYRIAADRRKGMTWYLDVRSHESWLGRFGAMQGQELSLHCYEHRTFNTAAENLSNIEAGIKAMEKAGFRPQGFAAPYGIWNPGLAEAIDVSGFAYSSEFSYAFDTLPFYPESNGVRWKALQVPVHPVCIGTMMRAGYPEISMREYFDRMVAVKTLRSEPLFFYHHPSHTHWDVVGHLFDSVDREGIGWFTLADFARWWRLREAAGLEGSISGDRLSIEEGEKEGDLWYEITMPDRHYLRQPFGQNTVDLRAWRSWRTRPAYASPGDVRRIHEFDLRTSLGDMYNTLLRKMP